MSQQQYAQQRLQSIQSQLRSAEANAGRDNGSVCLVGASKKQSPELIKDFAQAGLTHVGENYLQEAIHKVDALQTQNLTWHFIGQIQSNKTKTIAQHFDWVHSVDRVKIARRLAEQNTKKKPIKLLIQLNIDNETTKNGVPTATASELANDIAQMLSNNLNAELKGFMTIPKPRHDLAAQRATFAQAHELMMTTNQRFGLTLDQLSMGMSNDLEAAIAEGATMVRIGTNLFGARK